MLNCLVIIPVYNKKEVTKECLDWLYKGMPANSEIVIIDNGSTDGMQEMLKKEPVHLIENKENLGCSGAWNQGIAFKEAKWKLFLNNDALLLPGWFEALTNQEDYELVSPGIREGLLNYPFETYGKEYVKAMKSAARGGAVNGICFLVKNTVLEKVGGFDTNFKVGQYEDKDFFWRAEQAGFRTAALGKAFAHHYGSLTQKQFRSNDYAKKNKLYFHKKWHLGFFQRKGISFMEKMRNRWAAACEKRKYGHTLFEKWKDGRLNYY